MDGLLKTVSRPALTTAELKIVVFVPIANISPRVEVCELIPGGVVLLQDQRDKMFSEASEIYNTVLSKNLII
jgi:hypothetical protein